MKKIIFFRLQLIIFILFMLPVNSSCTSTADINVKVWIDDKQLVDFDGSDRKLTVSEELAPCSPLGMATWKTGSEIRRFKYRKLVTKKSE